jgi:hypothetical protein
MWTAELITHAIGHIAEEISKQSVEGESCLLEVCSKI